VTQPKENLLKKKTLMTRGTFAMLALALSHVAVAAGAPKLVCELQRYSNDKWNVLTKRSAKLFPGVEISLATDEGVIAVARIEEDPVSFASMLQVPGEAKNWPWVGASLKALRGSGVQLSALQGDDPWYRWSCSAE
jgi:hypothetical protein